MLKKRDIGFVATEDMTAAGISKKILEVIEPLQLDPCLCVGFSFDGSSIMSENRGVHVLLKRTFPHALYVHCNSHHLNLVLASSIKSFQSRQHTLNSFQTFMTGSIRHARFMEIQKQLHPSRQCLELERSIDTRWGSKSGSVSKVLILLDCILELLAECSGSSHIIETQGFLQQIQMKRFLFLLVIFGKRFECSDFSPTLRVLDCLHLVDGLKDVFSVFRDNSQCDFEKVLKLTDELITKREV